MDLAEERNVALRAARRAGMIADRYRTGAMHDDTGLEPSQKGSPNDLVTAADREAQRAILELLEDRFPADGVLAEEGVASEDADRVWVVDPIDGTANFVAGFPYFCVSIALRVDGEPVLGVVHAPSTSLDRTYHAVRGDGAYVDTGGSRRSISVSEHGTMQGATVFSRLSERDDERRSSDRRVVDRLLADGVRFRRAGSAALNLCQVAEGHAEGYALLSINPWDIEAGKVILEEAGGICRVRQSVFDDYIEIAASNGLVQDGIEDALAVVR